MPRTADAVVIGRGILGSAIALELSRKGLKTTLLGGPTSDTGSASTGVLSCGHASKPVVMMARETRQLYEEWAQDLAIAKPRASFERVGCAMFFALNDPAGTEMSLLLQAAGVTVEAFSGREAQGFLPGVRAARTKILFECGAGYMSSSASMASDLREAAAEAGTRLETNEQVSEIVSTSTKRNGQAQVIGLTTTSGLRIDTPVVVNAAPAFADRINLLAGAPLPLTTVPVIKRVVRVSNSNLSLSLPVVTDLPNAHSVRFDRKGFELTLLNGHHTEYSTADGETPKPADKTFVPERRRAFLRRHPNIKWSSARVRSAFSDRTVLDHHPIVDRTDLDGYYVAIGTSGCASRGGPLTGWLASELIAAVESGHDHDRKPLQVTLPRTGASFDLGLLSRGRVAIRPSVGTVAD